MYGTVDQCNLTPINKNYDYRETVTDLENKYGFNKIGEGGFGVILTNENCAIKIVKDISRCSEMKKEKDIYLIIKTNMIKYNINLNAKVPSFAIYEELNNFCHFNLERIYSALSGWGDVFDDDDHGYGYVLSETETDYIFNDISKNQLKTQFININKKKVYSIDRPGNLIHFYINYFDPDIKFKLDNNQGILMGKNYLEKYFKPVNIKKYTKDIGELLSFLVFICKIAPVDIEIVLGSRNKYDREVVPFIYDFNEAGIIPDNLTGNTLVEFIARSMFIKNGKNYFPKRSNIYYSDFQEGFRKYNRSLADNVLDKYNSYF